MLLTLPIQAPSHRRRRAAARPHVEQLETRNLLSGAAGLGSADPGDAPDILDPQLSPNLLGTASEARVSGTIVNRVTGSGDVDWYRFDLAAASAVTLTLPAGSLAGVLSLYNTTEPYHVELNEGDRYELLGHRLLAQAVGAPGIPVQIVRNLAPGTYYVAVSGAGNLHFHPFIADSGYPGSTGDYTLQVAAAALHLDPSTGPAVLAVDPGPAPLDTAPLVVRVSLSAPLRPGQVIELRDAAGIVQPEWTNFSVLANEFQIAPRRALAPGTYSVVLVDAGRETVLSTLEISGTENNRDGSADDHLGDPFRPAGAHDLGELLGRGLVQRTGAIGDDPAYDPDRVDEEFPPFLQNRAADVDLYHFEITAPGRYALLAEVFAGRIGSPLDPGLSLFRVNPDGVLELVAVNDNSYNDTVVPGNLRPPLWSDSLLFTGLSAGHYYLAVSSSGPIGLANLADPDNGLPPGEGGVFDPNISHSGRNGTTTGHYVLNVMVVEDSEAPRVVSTTPAAGTTVTESPTEVVVQFSEAVNLPQLANRAFFSFFQPTPAAAYIEGAAGAFALVLKSYDSLINRATFLLSGRLPDGLYRLHLVGVTDLADNPLAEDGDFVIPFTVAASVPDSGPVIQEEQEPNDSPFEPQDLGALGRRGLVVQGSLLAGSSSGGTGADLADFFAFELSEFNHVVFTLSPRSDGMLPEGLVFLLLGPGGVPVMTPISQMGNSLAFVARWLQAGAYVVQVGFWDEGQAADVDYQLQVSRFTLPENPTPLTSGPVPAIGLRLTTRSQPPPVPQPTPPQVVPVGGSPTGRLSPAVTPGARENASSLFTTLPPGSLVFLGGGPLGARNPSAAAQALATADRVELGGVNTTLVAALIRLTILTPVNSGVVTEEPIDDLEGLVEQSIDLMQKSWEQILDGLFGMAGWLREMAAPSANAAAEAEVPIDPSEGEDVTAWDSEVGPALEEAADGLAEVGPAEVPFVSLSPDFASLSGGEKDEEGDGGVSPAVWAALAVGALFGQVRHRLNDKVTR
ncbi:MAG TPA: DVUA0089 family protein [Gemmataceae bacterium]|nr:DVUA0089 family protein [Gemmataceae bacterium]